MNYESFSVWAHTKGVNQAKARRVFTAAELEASRFSRTDPEYWSRMHASIKASLGIAPSSIVEKAVRGLSGLASHLRHLPGSTSFTEEGHKLRLTYTRNASNGLDYPFSDYCNLDIEYDTRTQVYQTSGVVFGSAIPVPLMNEPGIFLQQSLEVGASFNAIVRDFLNRALVIAERYTGQNIDLYTYKLQTELRAIGSIERLDRSKLPNVAVFTAADVQFQAWFAMSSLGVGMIKFNPALTISGYLLSPRTFTMLLGELDKHVIAHQEFVRACISAVNRV